MRKADKEHNPYYAAIDLGSNSFHMIVARRTGVGINVTDRLRSPVRLAAGLTEDAGSAAKPGTCALLPDTVRPTLETYQASRFVQWAPTR